MNRKSFITAQIFLVLFMLIGCKPTGTTLEPATSTLPVISISPTATEIMTHVPQPTFTPAPTAIPTLSSEQEKAYTELSELIITNAGCELPCWWGLKPGTSNFQDAQERLGPLSVIADFYSAGDKGGISFSYPVNDLFLSLYVEHSAIPDNSLQQDFIGALNVSTYIYKRIDLTGGDFVFERIYDSGAYQKLLSAYTLSATLSKFGAPSEILVRAEVYDGYPRPDRLFLTLLYPDKGIFATYTITTTTFCITTTF